MSVPQLTALIEFFEVHPELAFGRHWRTKEGRSVATALWQECASILNRISPHCTQRTPAQWRMFYNDYKHKMMTKLRAERTDNTTGLGPPKAAVLTPLQERLYTILGRQVDDPVTATRSYNTSTLTTITINEADGPPTKNVKEDSSDDAASSNDSDHETVPAEYYWLESLPETEKLEQQSNPSCSRIKNEIPQFEVHVDCSPADPGLGSHAGESEHVKRTRLHAQRQRRRRRHVIPDPSMRMAMQMLKEMKDESAQAMRQNARATNRLAAAIEAINERLKEPLRIIIENASSSTTDSGTIFRVNLDPDKK